MILQKVLLIQNPVIKEQYTVALHAVIKSGFHLENQQHVSLQRIVFLPTLNPWGFKGVTIPEILKHFKELSLVEDFTDVPGVYIPQEEKLVGFKGSLGPSVWALTYRKLYQLIMKASECPYSLGDSEKIGAGTDFMKGKARHGVVNIKWIELFRTDTYMDDGGMATLRRYLNIEHKKWAHKPFYTVSVSTADPEVNFLADNRFVSSILTADMKYAKQFYNEDDAVFIALAVFVSKTGFDIVRTEPEKYKYLTLRRSNIV